MLIVCAASDDEVGSPDEPAGFSDYNLVCYYRNCNRGSGRLFNFSSCYQWGWGTWYPSLGSWNWRVNISFGYRAYNCRSVWWDFVDANVSREWGLDVTITWKGSWNNGAYSPFYFTDAGFNATVWFHQSLDLDLLGPLVPVRH